MCGWGDFKYFCLFHCRLPYFLCSQKACGKSIKKQKKISSDEIQRLWNSPPTMSFIFIHIWAFLFLVRWDYISKLLLWLQCPLHDFNTVITSTKWEYKTSEVYAYLWHYMFLCRLLLPAVTKSMNFQGQSHWRVNNF